MDAMDTLIKAVRKKRVILFVGAGVSCNLSDKLPTWSGLIGEMAKRLGFDEQIFKLLGDYSALAEYYHIKHGSFGDLRSELDVAWHGGSANIDIGQSEIHNLIVKLDLPIIYTTNYDRWLEKSFQYHEKKFVKIAGLRDFPNIPNTVDGVSQIVKFHGDFDDDSSLVLTESSYFERLSFESPLDIKFRADTLGRPVLFIGYSMSDINIRYLIYRLNKIWESALGMVKQPPSYMFLANPNPVAEAILENRGICPFVSASDDPKEGLTHFLNQLSAP